MKTFGVIGSGVAGLATAIRLKTESNRVVVFEANNYAGGKLTQLKRDGFRFDAGPSLFTMPQLLDEVFISKNKNPRDYYDYIRIEPACHYFWPDETRFHAPGNPDEFALQASQKFGVEQNTIEKYLKEAFKIYDITEDVFLKNSLHKFSTYFRWSTFRSFIRLHRIRMMDTMNRVNEKELENPKLVQLFNRYATYNGSNPYKAPGTLTLIPTLEYRWGTFLPKGGMHQITQALLRLAEDIGVEFRFGEPVTKLSFNDNRITELITSKSNYSFDKIISNMDVVSTYGKLLGMSKKENKLKKIERSSSGLIFYWGINRTFPELGLHNIFWSENYAEEFRQLFDLAGITDDPTIYVNITSKHEKTDAPDGMENWFVLINAPSSKSQDWEELRRKVRGNVIRKLSDMLKTDIEKHIVVEEFLDPIRIEEKTSSHLGSLYGTSSNSRNAAFLRHPNFSRKFENLFFCGGSVHPGGGIPLCLRSAEITSKMANE